MKPSSRIFVLILIGVLALVVLAACATHQSLAKKHPMDVQGMPLCSTCHTDGRAALDHNADYITRHKFYAAQQKATCDLCHAPAFCADCHAHKEELKPSDKYKDAPTLVHAAPGRLPEPAQDRRQTESGIVLSLPWPSEQ